MIRNDYGEKEKNKSLMNFFSNRSHLGVSTLNTIKDVQVKDEMWRQTVCFYKEESEEFYLLS